MAKIKFNGETREIEQGATAESILRQAGIDPATVIVVVNGDVVERANLALTSLKEGDSLDLLQVAGGG